MVALFLMASRVSRGLSNRWSAAPPSASKVRLSLISEHFVTQLCPFEIRW